jgi:hypothetical protein
MYAIESGQFIEEYHCHAIARSIIREKNWTKLDILAKIAISVRAHIILMLVKKITKLDFDNSLKLFKMIFKKIPIQS